MPKQKKVLLLLISFLLTIFSTFSQPVFASQNKYFDYGPYYQSNQVLGFTFSSFENLPSLKVPDNILPAPTKGILPDSPFYPLERVFENTQLALTFNDIQKEQLRLQIAEERLSEAKTLMDSGKIQAASRALNDYSSTLTDISQNLASLAQQANPEAKELVDELEKSAATQAIALSALSLDSPPSQAENWTEAGKSSRDMLDKIAEVKGEPAIPENLSTDLQQLKEQGLLSEEESNKIYSLKNRSEVRNEFVKLSSSGGLPPSEIAKLDDAVNKFYPEIQNQQLANLQIIELRSYQTLNQPSDKIREDLQKWQENSNTPPSNDIKPYLWYNRAQDIAKKVDLSDFSEDQQGDLLKYYPQATTNPTYSPPPSPSPIPSPSPSPITAVSPTPSATVSPSPVPSPSPSPVPADPYLEDPNGALPGDPTYILKQFGENLTFTFTFDPAAKARLRLEEAEARLAEANRLSKDPKKASYYEATLKAYQQTISDASNRVKDLKNDKDAKEAAEKLEAQAARHEVVFEKGLLPPPAKNNKLLSDIIKTTEDALDRSSDALDRPALPPALASRLGDLKAQGLILEEEAEDLVKSASREEVRGKIRKLLEQKTFPLADAKKLDEAQSQVSPADYNQLVEVRKVEELQNLRAVQTDLAQTPTLKSQVSQLDQKASQLDSSFDPTLIKPEDLGGRENLVKAYEKLASIPRPINGGQFGAEATPGAKPVVTPPSPRDAVLTTCPEGATFKQFEGCVWADSGKSLSDYEQYKCDSPRQYYSFNAKKCVAYDPTKGYQEDGQPICPVGYTWSWPTQSCQTSRGGILPYPSPSAYPKPQDVGGVEELNKSCPEGSSFLPPSGCFWDDGGGSVYDPKQYRCSEGQYYSFEEHKCVPIPKPGVPYPKNTTPTCKAEGLYWNWSTGQCLPPPAVADEKPLGSPEIIDVKPTFVTPGNPLYFLKQAAERVQYFTAFTPVARQQVTLSQAEERLAEAADALKKGDQQAVKKAINTYTSMMQNIVADVSKESLTQGAKDQIAKRLKEESAEHNLLLEKLQALSPAELDTPINAAVSASILGVDKAADIAGEPAIPDALKSKIEALPEKMISEEDKKALLEMDSRVDARLKLGGLITNGALTQTDASFLNEDFDAVDLNTKLKVEELKKLEEIADASENREKLVEKVEKNEEIAQKLQEFEKTFEVGNEVPAEIRPYVSLTRINEVTQTIRPDIVRLEDFQNRKDVVLAVATLQEEFKPTKESWAKVEDFRRKNPGAYLPPELARIEALSFSLGVRTQAETCYLPTPPFAPNTPCPAPGAAIPITSYTNYIADIADRDFPVYRPGYRGPNTGYGNVGAPSLDKDGKAFVYGQGPKPESSGVCSDGYHWMYDSGGWCMSNSGNYSQSSYNYTPSGPQTPGYTPYSPYYNAPGAPPSTYGYPVGGNYPSSPYSYSPPSYYGPGPTTYLTNPPSGTVPGSGPKPTAPGQCPSGFHWMSDSGGWCMSDGPTYVPPGGSPGYPTPGGPSDRGSTPWCWSAFPPPGGWTCGSGSSWDQSSCACKPLGGTPGPSSGVNCGSGYTWNGNSCQPSSGPGSNCTYPSGGCPGYGSWYDYSSCSCKTTSYTYPGGPTSPGSCSPPSGGCGSGWFDYSSCSCKQASPQGCYNVSASSCGSGWYWDSAACTCRQSSPPTPGGGGGGSCPSGSHWMSDNGGYCMSDSATTSSGGGGSTSGGSSACPCPSGYHCMDNSWCMSDAARDSGSSGGGGTSTATPTPSSTPQPEQQQQSTPAPTTQPEQQPTSAPTTAPASEPTPAPSG